MNKKKHIKKHIQMMKRCELANIRIEKFASNPKNVFFMCKGVRQAMADALNEASENGKSMTLRAAYTQGIRKLLNEGL